MAQLLTFRGNSHDDALVDFASALITGDVDFSIGVSDHADGTSGHKKISMYALLETNIIPQNGASNTIVIGKDDDDISAFIPVEGKAVEGNLFVAYRNLTSPTIPTSGLIELDTFLNDLRQICDNVSCHIIGQLSSSFDGSVSAAKTQTMIAYGTLKETQSDDYNPLTVISVDWKYKMFDSQVVQQLASNSED